MHTRPAGWEEGGEEEGRRVRGGDDGRGMEWRAEKRRAVERGRGGEGKGGGSLLSSPEGRDVNGERRGEERRVGEHRLEASTNLLSSTLCQEPSGVRWLSG